MSTYCGIKKKKALPEYPSNSDVANVEDRKKGVDRLNDWPCIRWPWRAAFRQYAFEPAWTVRKDKEAMIYCLPIWAQVLTSILPNRRN